MFRRRRSQVDEPELDDADWEAEEGEEAEEGPQPIRDDGGPWDADEPFPGRERVDLGSLRVPVGPGHEVQLVMHEQHGAWVTIRYEESELQMQAFAVARNDVLWDDHRAEIAADIEAAGGQCTESEGLFGIALDAEVPVDPANPALGLRTVRFVGVDGPRWLLRGMFSGPAAASGGDADVLEDVFRDIVVFRGEHPVPPRDLLELRLPPEAVQAMAEAEQAQHEEEQGGSRWGEVNPLERGPEFTETR